ncbi:hypothetical protein HN803_07255 [candidate division WWE3 bacterium]|nr:hypothetical protein [candidate division WWE3 bacterium]
MLKQKNFTNDDTVIYHFRLATHGLTAQGQTHPFPISTDQGELCRTRLETDIGMVHNGILNAMEDDKILSDTMMYVKHVLNPIKDKLFEEDMSQLIGKTSIGSRLAFLNKEGSIIMTGDWEEEDNGLYYSNDGYKWNRTTGFGIEDYYYGKGVKKWYRVDEEDDKDTTSITRADRLNEVDLMDAWDKSTETIEGKQIYEDSVTCPDCENISYNPLLNYCYHCYWEAVNTVEQEEAICAHEDMYMGNMY